jgi:hypothetical protein
MDPLRPGMLVQKTGRPVTLKRSGVADLPVTAKVRGYQPQEVIGEVQQGDRLVIFGTAEITAAVWPAPPKKGDQIVIDRTTTVESVEARYVGSVAALYFARVRG